MHRLVDHLLGLVAQARLHYLEVCRGCVTNLLRLSAGDVSLKDRLDVCCPSLAPTPATRHFSHYQFNSVMQRDSSSTFSCSSHTLRRISLEAISSPCTVSSSGRTLLKIKPMFAVLSFSCQAGEGYAWPGSCTRFYEHTQVPRTIVVLL